MKNEKFRIDRLAVFILCLYKVLGNLSSFLRRKRAKNASSDAETAGHSNSQPNQPLEGGSMSSILIQPSSLRLR
jgi:hypothetical protein